ncbi:hypothetical protein Q8A67_025513 [Cirrhinus molitorella]|uniref:Uncharacterized protein n=1 Tax=Cirrhinus molitorella TaxID=172907 RepID=A0AA88NZR9_9TELE|nr:hypothetical protein Q8A67_025513 [Cirrhinus molitorella]
MSRPFSIIRMNNLEKGTSSETLIYRSPQLSIVVKEASCTVTGAQQQPPALGMAQTRVAMETHGCGA